MVERSQIDLLAHELHNAVYTLRQCLSQHASLLFFLVQSLQDVRDVKCRREGQPAARSPEGPFSQPLVDLQHSLYHLLEKVLLLIDQQVRRPVWNNDDLVSAFAGPSLRVPVGSEDGRKDMAKQRQKTRRSSEGARQASSL
jgi:hypothetical protein